MPYVTIRAAGLVAALGLVLALAQAPMWATVPVGLLLVLVLPGYVWQNVFRSDAGAPLEALLITVMTSVGVAIMTGLLLNALPGGLTTRSWAIALTIIVELGVATNLVTGHRKAWQTARGPRPLGLAAMVKIVAAIGCVVAAAVISLSSQSNLNKSEHFTTLSLAGIEGSSPVVTVADHQNRRVTYELSVLANGHALKTQMITLRPGGRIALSLRKYGGSSQHPVRVMVTLKVPGSQAIYREVWFESAG